MNELLEYALPFDRRDAGEHLRLSRSRRTPGRGAHEITAAVHDLLPTRADVDPDKDGLRSNYRRVTGSERRFAPGGANHFSPLCHRVNAAGWRPAGLFPGQAHTFPRLTSVGSTALDWFSLG